MERVVDKNGKELPLFVEQVDGKDVYLLMEKNDEDGGIITCTLVPNDDGTVYAHRAWRGAGIKATAEDKAWAHSEAIDVFTKLTAVEIKSKADLAPVVSGKLDAQQIKEKPVK